ncbi:zinc finger CCCH domain-containing protein 6-like isoform X2 [Andrographis paniculata]|nr:zinc finger CCCH domain-containing protein 6-like isoform X2 [Andrographis paniculata]
MVTWASDVNLCQVRLFLTEESPSRVGMGTQDSLQAKPLWPLQSGVMVSNDSLPPGFDGIRPANPWRAKPSRIPLVKWSCPPRLQINPEWLVVSGEESREIEVQNHREMKVFEAIYPHPSAVPPNPSALPGAEDSVKNDKFTPVVPITPEEDEDGTTDTPLVSSAAGRQPSAPATSSSPISGAAGVDPNIVIAAQAALKSVMPSNKDLGNLLDPALLLKLLSNPKMVEQLLASRAAVPTSSHHALPFPARPQTTVSTVPQNFQPSGPPAIQLQTAVFSTGPHLQIPSSSNTPNTPSTSAQYSSYPRSAPNASPGPINIPIARRDPPSMQSTRQELGTLPMSTPYYPPPRTGPPSFSNLRPSAPDGISAATPSIAKDMNYFKSLIQQHGEERKETMPQHTHQNNLPFPTSMTSQESQKPKHRITKPCMFYNSPRGCRNGDNCMYLHAADAPSRQRVAAGGSNPEFQSSKRMKLDGA